MKRNVWVWVLICVLTLCCFSAGAEEAVQAEENQWRNILLLGGDSRTETGYGRTDAMIILSVNYEENLLKMTSIMRDTWVKFPGLNISHKINAANVYGGPELAMETVNSYFGTDIKDYIMINMENLVDIVDLLGGVDVTITEEERQHINERDPEHPVHETGLVHLNGHQALAFTRDRYTDNDYGRVMRQQAVLLSLGTQMQNMDVDVLMEKVGEILEHVQTNMETNELKELATVGMIVEVEDIQQHRIPEDGTFESGMYEGYWMIRPNFEKNAELLHDFIYSQEIAEAE